MVSGPITSWKIDGETMETVSDFGAPKSLQTVTGAMKLKDTCFWGWGEAMTNPDNILKNRNIT